MNYICIDFHVVIKDCGNIISVRNPCYVLPNSLMQISKFSWYLVWLIKKTELGCSITEFRAD